MVVKDSLTWGGKEENVEMEERMDKMVGLSEKVVVGLKNQIDS